MQNLSPRGRVILFCLITFTFTWAWWGWRFFPYLAAGRAIDRGQVGPLDVQVGMAGPLVAAVALRILTRRGVRGSLGYHRSWKIYLMAYLIPMGLGILAILFNHLTGLGQFDWAGETILTIAPGMLLLTVFAALTALCEEYGWRGYLLPNLLPLGKTRATLITGMIWGVWHLPLLVLGLTYLGQAIWLAVPVFVLCTTLLSFLFTWFYEISSGSVVIAALVHGTINVLSELTAPEHIPAGSTLVIAPFGLTMAAVAFLAVQAIVLMQRNAADVPSQETI